MNPRFPIYIPSRGRADSRLTMRALQRLGVPFFVIVHADELDTYAAVLPRSSLLVLPQSYLDTYEVCDTFDSPTLGPGPSRNFAWDHSTAAGSPWHWTMDDNIRGFYRQRHNTQYAVADGTCLRVMEDFVLRYANIAMAGPHYDTFVKRSDYVPPYRTNIRIYSCQLIRNDVPFRWRSRFNDDTDLSLRMLKAGWVTVIFNAFLAKKTATMRVPGGNTDLYQGKGRLLMAEALRALHPDVTRVAWRWHRWQHVVDYRLFTQPLIRRPEVTLPDGPDNYGMQLYRVP